MTIAAAKIYPANSDSYAGTGLKPDYLSELPAGADPSNITRDADVQLHKALEVLSTTAG